MKSTDVIRAEWAAANALPTLSSLVCATTLLMPDVLSNIDQARAYLKAIEDGNADLVANLFAPDAVIEQLPNRLYPQGLRADVSQVAAAFEKGRKLFVRQTYEITNHVVVGNMVALEVLWTGTLAASFGSLAVGNQMRCHSAMFLEFRDGLLTSQRNYDCFDAW